MTPEDHKKLEYLCGLHSIGVELTQNMICQLEELQVKEQKLAAVKVLSHGGISTVTKN